MTPTMLRSAHEIAALSAQYFGPGRLRIATAGYSACRDRAHLPRVQALLQSLIWRLGPGRVGLVTSPTSSPDSIDRATTAAALQAGAAVLHVTASEFLGAARLDGPSSRLWGEQIAKIPRYVLPTREAYSEATAHASDALLLAGGGPASVSDFAHAMRLGHRALVALDPLLDAPTWNTRKKAPTHAARYLADLLDSWDRGLAPPHPVAACLDEEARRRWPAGWRERVRCVEIPCDIDAAAAFLDPGA